MRTITLIQFHNHTEDSDDRTGRTMVGNWFILDDEDAENEFYDGDDDEGDSIYINKSCVSYFDSFDDYLADDNRGYMVRRNLKYTLISMDVNFDEENDNINWNIA